MIAVNIEATMPIIKVTPKPFTGPEPNGHYFHLLDAKGSNSHRSSSPTSWAPGLRIFFALGRTSSAVSR